jgi:hypothetical protein
VLEVRREVKREKKRTYFSLLSSLFYTMQVRVEKR